MKSEPHKTPKSKTLHRELRQTSTKPEQLIWAVLRNRRFDGLRIRRQESIGPFIVDFVCFERRVIVEVDGGQHAERSEYDSERTRWLKSRNYRVLRFWNNEVLAQTDTVAQAIADALIDTPHLDPPPQGGRR